MPARQRQGQGRPRAPGIGFSVEHERFLRAALLRNTLPRRSEPWPCGSGGVERRHLNKGCSRSHVRRLWRVRTGEIRLGTHKGEAPVPAFPSNAPISRWHSWAGRASLGLRGQQRSHRREPKKSSLSGAFGRFRWMNTLHGSRSLHARHPHLQEHRSGPARHPAATTLTGWLGDSRPRHVERA